MACMEKAHRKSIGNFLRLLPAAGSEKMRAGCKLEIKCQSVTFLSPPLHEDALCGGNPTAANIRDVVTAVSEARV